MQDGLSHRLRWECYWVALFLLLCNIAMAQPAPVSPPTSQLIAQLLLRSEQQLSLNPGAALTEAEQALQLASATKRPTDIAVAHMAVGAALEAQRQYEPALRHFQLARQTYRKTGNRRAQALALRRIGHAQYVEGDTGQARNTALQALRLAQQLRNSTEIAQSYAQLGEMYGQQGLWERALVSHERAYSEWQQAANPNGQATALNAIGLTHFQLRHFSRSLYYLNRALTEARQLSDSTRIGEALASTGRVYDALGNYEVAQGFYGQALTQLPRVTPPARRAEGLRALAVAYDSVGNQPAAIQAVRRALPLARQGGSAVQLSSLYQLLTTIYRRTGDYQSALQTQTQYTNLQDSAFVEQRTAQVAELRTRYETEKKEREIQLLTKDRQLQQVRLQRQLLVRNVLAVGALVLLMVVFALYRGRRRQLYNNKVLQQKNQAIEQQKEELGRLNRTKDTLFSIISHDLRSPLSSLYSLFSLMNMGTLPPERLATHSQRLTRTLDVTLRLLDNLLNWSASQMQGDKVRPEKIRLQPIVEEAMGLLAGDAERKTIAVFSDIPALSTVRADLDMLRLVVRNLLGNAIKFTPSNGQVRISARQLEGQGLWEINVEDNGVGIAAADLPKIFGETGLHSTLGTALEKGAGLGLRLCKEFVERNGGSITCESQLGSGTTLRFTLPMAAPEIRPLAPAESATAVAV
jgi:two-component system sensor histidine kinase/response regulator